MGPVETNPVLFTSLRGRSITAFDHRSTTDSELAQTRGPGSWPQYLKKILKMDSLIQTTNKQK